MPCYLTNYVIEKNLTRYAILKQEFTVNNYNEPAFLLLYRLVKCMYLYADVSYGDVQELNCEKGDICTFLFLFSPFYTDLWYLLYVILFDVNPFRLKIIIRLNKETMDK